MHECCQWFAPKCSLSKTSHLRQQSNARSAGWILKGKSNKGSSGGYAREWKLRHHYGASQYIKVDRRIAQVNQLRNCAGGKIPEYATVPYFQDAMGSTKRTAGITRENCQFAYVPHCQFREDHCESSMLTSCVHFCPEQPLLQASPAMLGHCLFGKHASGHRRWVPIICMHACMKCLCIWERQDGKKGNRCISNDYCISDI